ncbi:hypothetical protein BDZ97DRAFT_1904344 [Flammula alnicola]|nr:hypothetical protein BDZ97DRAFT_1904344 [Flammula alnicola]
MSDIQKATLSLVLLVESCNAAVKGLSEEANDIGDYPTSDFTILRTDFISLLSILYAATTKVALSLKPSAPQHKASLVPLKDISNNVAALVHSIRLMRLKEGVTVVREYESVAHNVISSIRALGQTLQSSPSDGTASEEYLVRTGEVHELIDTARKSGGLSLNNRDAVRKIWLRDHDSLVDGAEEIQEMCKPSSADEEEGAFDDGWEELGISSNQKLSPAELDRTAKVQAVLKLAILLHKRVIKDILSSDTRLKDNMALDKIAMLSGKLLVASDDFISSMYAPQQPSNITPYLASFWDVIKDIRVTILPSQDNSLEEQLNGLLLSSQASDKTRKWFTTCFEQIDKAAAKVSDTLRNPIEDSS